MYRLTSHGASENSAKATASAGEAGFGLDTQDAQQWLLDGKLPPCFSKALSVYPFTQVFTANREEGLGAGSFSQQAF